MTNKREAKYNRDDYGLKPRSTGLRSHQARQQGKLEPWQIWVDPEDLDKLHELAPEYVKRHNLPVTPKRAASFMIKKFLKQGIEMLEKEKEPLEDES